MPSRIIVISGTHPQHLQIALDHGFWDFTRFRPVEDGDDLFFWVSGGGGLRAWVRARSSTVGLAGEPEPWEDSGVRTYTHRIYFESVSTSPAATPSWADVQQGVSTGQLASNGFLTVASAEGEQWLQDQFVSLRVDLGRGTTPVELSELAVPHGHDLRDRQIREVAVRRGQREFRTALLRAYRGRCAVTGSTVESVLEAAHIEPYREQQHHQVRNGILLRADLHTLFDLHAWTLGEDLAVIVGPELRESEYAEYEGVVIANSLASTDRPSRDVVSRHREASQAIWAAMPS